MSHFPSHKGQGKDAGAGAGAGIGVSGEAESTSQSYVPSVAYYTPAQFFSGSTGVPSPQPAAPYTAPSADPDYAQFMEHYGGSAAADIVYESKRATRQMAHYFDVAQYKRHLDTPSVSGTASAAATAGPKKKITKQDLERFKKRKEERKRIRNKWLYE